MRKIYASILFTFLSGINGFVNAQNLQFNRILFLSSTTGNWVVGTVPSGQIYKITSMSIPDSNEYIRMDIDTSGSIPLTGFYIASSNSNSTTYSPLPIWMPSGAGYRFGNSFTGAWFVNIVVYDVVP